MKEAGWWTASFGKTFDPRTSDNCDMPYSWSQPPQSCTCDGTGTLPDNNRASHVAVAQSDEPGLVDPPIVDQALDFLRTYSHDEAPFFMAVGLHRPHLPFMVPERMLALYPPTLPSAQPANNDFAPNGVPPIGWTYSGEIHSYNYNTTVTGWKNATGDVW